MPDVKSWEVVERPLPYGDRQRRFRIQVTYADGAVRILRPAFATRTDLDKYVRRFHPELQGNESA